MFFFLFPSSNLRSNTLALCPSEFVEHLAGVTVNPCYHYLRSTSATEAIHFLFMVKAYFIAKTLVHKIQ